MLKPWLRTLVATAALLFTAVVAGYADNHSQNARTADVGFIEIDQDITLRRMIVHNPSPKGTVLFLHGFPETLYVWKDISIALGDEYEVHSFDWPGYGKSSRPAVEKFSYAPKSYADVLKAYIEKAGIDQLHLTIYATDIGALPALLLALDEPSIAKSIIVGDFAPFNRPAYMFESLQNLKAEPAASKTRAYMNKTSAEILANAYRRDLPKEQQFDLKVDVNYDMIRSWGHGDLTSADAFYYYYSNFTRDQEYFEANLDKLRTPVKVIWGERDFYIEKEMGREFAAKTGAKFDVLPGVGHYPHLQIPEQTIREVRASFR